MIHHNPPQSLMAVLVTCELCSGETAYRNADDELCACTMCSNGYVSIALPLMDVMHAATIPSDTARHAYLLNCAKQQGKIRHPLLFGSSECPLSYHTPLKPNPSDAKRRIPLQ